MTQELSNKKIRVGVLFGGKSAEHEVSLQSAHNVMNALDKEKYEAVPISIEKSGKWMLQDDPPKHVALVPQSGGELIGLARGRSKNRIDVVFPVLHGTFGEDGTVQGLLKLADVPFVGAGVLGSAVGMDKDVQKRLLRDAGIPVANFLAFRSGQMLDFANIVKTLGLPLFVKPANLGSSVGVSKVHHRDDFRKAAATAFEYDTKILAEEFVRGREIECAVLGNDDPKASVPGEILPHHDFYSYEAKYLDENGASLEVPAKISPEISRKIRDTAVLAFKTLACEGMGRVDFFLKENGDILVNEINTIPGFTSISMYPRLWQASGVSYTELIDRLIELALERFRREQKLRTSYVV